MKRSNKIKTIAMAVILAATSKPLEEPRADNSGSNGKCRRKGPV